MTVARLFPVLVLTGCLTAAAEEPPRKAPTDGGIADGGKGVLLPPSIGKGQLLSDPSRPPHRPTLPDELNQPGNVVWGFFKVCVNDAGSVSDVKVLKSAHEKVDAAWIKTIRGWRYRPYSISGRTVPFCYPLRLEVRSTAS